MKTSYEYDVIFTEAGEINAEENWKKLLTSFPTAKRIKDAPTIYDAYHQASILSEHELLLIVDADNVLMIDDLNLQSKEHKWKLEGVLDCRIVMVWRAINRVNTIINGHGGLKLFSKKSLQKVFTGADVTMGLGLSIGPVSNIGSIHAFDYNEYNTWKTAFREAAKLVYNPYFMSPICLDIWKREGFGKYGAYSIGGAICGEKFARESSEGALVMVNNRDWLKSEYEQFLKQQHKELKNLTDESR